MNDDIVKLDPTAVSSIEWTGDYIDYDTQLCRLGSNYDRFIVFNPWLEDKSLIHYVNEIPPNYKCIVWVYNGEWVAKFFDSDWTYENGSKVIEIVKPEFLWNKNPDIDKSMEFENNPFGNFEPDYWDSEYELVWYMDPKVNPTDDKIWVMNCKPIGKKTAGIKDMGYVMPLIDVEYNEELPSLGIDIDQCYPAYWDLNDICAWELDPIHTPDNRMWVVKFTAVYKKINSWKWYGTISPQYEIEHNPDLPKINYIIDYAIPWHDLAYEHVWYLTGPEKIWFAKVSTINNIIGVKEMSSITPDISIQLDVIFISYDELNAEENWERLLEKAPYAKRVNGIKGIFNAHKAAAKLATTDMFFVVDGDAYLTYDWEFDFNPGIFDRDCTYVWKSKNPLNNLTYGYGGVKLFTRSKVNSLKSWGTDLTLSVNKKLKVMDSVSNITRFNTSEYNTWKSAFRECAKLVRKDDILSKERLQAWLNPTESAMFAEWAKKGAEQGIAFANSQEDMININDYEWLKQVFINNYNSIL